MVSICLATYNGSSFIVSQLKSILCQLDKTDEIIISDDYSKDNTVNLIESIADPRIKLYYNENRKGPVGNFENALLKANGEFIFLADQDDFWFNTKIASHLKYHKEFDLVISDARVINEEGEILFDSFFKARGSKQGFFHNLKKNSYVGCCMSFNRKILNLSLPFPRQIHMHDWWIGLVAELRGKVKFAEERQMNYIRHLNNASPTLSESGYSVRKRLLNRIKLIFGLFKILLKR